MNDIWMLICDHFNSVPDYILASMYKIKGIFYLLISWAYIIDIEDVAIWIFLGFVEDD